MEPDLATASPTGLLVKDLTGKSGLWAPGLGAVREG